MLGGSDYSVPCGRPSEPSPPSVQRSVCTVESSVESCGSREEEKLWLKSKVAQESCSSSLKSKWL